MALTIVFWIVILAIVLLYVHAVFHHKTDVLIAVTVISITGILLAISAIFVVSAAIGIVTLTVFGVRRLYLRRG
ncbi:MAG: hypothetical protein WC749_04745 [Dehalococcoidia bacterium]